MFVNTIFTEYHNHSILKIHFVTSARPMVEYLKVCVYGIDALNNYNVAKKNKSIHRYYIVWCTLTVNTEVGFIFLAVVTQIHVIESKPSKSRVTELSFFVNVTH